MPRALRMLSVVGLAATAVVVVVSLAGPGLFLARRMGWDAEETLAAAPLLSILAIGMARFGFFLVGRTEGAGWALLAACAVLLVLAAPEALRLWSDAGARRAFAALALLAAYLLLLHATVRNYGGANWTVDWLEHFERARFWLGGKPTTATFVGSTVPARPPLLNLFACQILSLGGHTFAVYQIAVTLAAACAFGPLLLLARAFSGHGSRAGTTAGGAQAGPPVTLRLPLVLAAWLMLQPMFVENACYPMTKQVSVAFILAAAAFYLRGLAERCGRRLAAAALFAGGALLTHYSALPYVALLGGHLVVSGWARRGRRARDLVWAAAIPAAVIAPWLGWVAWTYGPASAVTTTATWKDAARYEGGSQIAKEALNLYDTIVPPFVRGEGMDLRGPSVRWGGLREAAFLAYQSNALIAFGSAGLVLLIVTLVRARRGGRSPDAAFWIGWAFAGLLGITLHGAREVRGLAHLTLQPVVLAGVAYLTANATRWGPVLRAIATIGLAIDALLGIALHFWLQGYPMDLPPGWTGPFRLSAVDLEIGFASTNWMLKRDNGLTFLGDLLAPTAPWPALAAAFLAAAMLMTIIGRNPHRHLKIPQSSSSPQNIADA